MCRFSIIRVAISAEVLTAVLLMFLKDLSYKNGYRGTDAIRRCESQPFVSKKDLALVISVFIGLDQAI